MRSFRLFFLFSMLIACEEVVEVDLPNAQNLIVVEGFVSDVMGKHPVRVARSNSFSDDVPFIPVENAQLIVQSRSGDVYGYEYRSDGYYEAVDAYKGASHEEYRVRFVIEDAEIRSYWDQLPATIAIGRLEIASFRENDPTGADEQITIYFPKMTTADPRDTINYYRWIFYKNGTVFSEPDPIIIQNDRTFDGNLIPNNFRNFEYTLDDSVSVQLLAISRETFGYLSLLRSQITTLGTSAGTTPAVVNGNLFYTDNATRTVLGNFSAVSLKQTGLRIQ